MFDNIKKLIENGKQKIFAIAKLTNKKLLYILTSKNNANSKLIFKSILVVSSLRFEICSSLDNIERVMALGFVSNIIFDFLEMLKIIFSAFTSNDFCIQNSFTDVNSTFKEEILSSQSINRSETFWTDLKPKDEEVSQKTIDFLHASVRTTYAVLIIVFLLKLE